ncbi:MAG: hypothetical protein HY820_06365 [Acidobacteria bacterium]|nr:hypothetical protein [Acidobacteriota bacterium]
MKWMVVAFFMAASLLSAQDVQTVVTPLGVPCEPGQANPLGDNFPVICPAADQQGALVFVGAPGSTKAGFKVTVNYTDADGGSQTATQTVARNAEGDWTVVVFQIGRLQTTALSGNQITSVTAEGVDSLEPADEPEE